MKSLPLISNQLTPKILLSVGLVSLLAACSATLNTQKLEDVIKKGIEEQTNSEVTAISCPEKVELEEGDTFECEVEGADGRKASVTVTQQDDQGNVSWKLNSTSSASTNDPDSSSRDDSAPANRDPNAPVFDSSTVERTVKEQFADQTGIPIDSVECPQNVAVNVNSKFNCTVTATEGKTIEAVITQTNEEGGFSWNATNGLISYDKVENLIRNGIRDQENLTVTPQCGTSRTRYIIAYKGETFSCTAEDPNGRNIPIQVSVQSDDGQVQVSWNL